MIDVNPLGVQNDRIYNEASRHSDSSWDIIYDSAGRITDEGYIVEVGIPFSSLRFPRSSDIQTWAFSFRRYHPREVYRRIAFTPYDRNNPCRTCQHSYLRGFKDISPGRNLQVTPTVVGVQSAARNSNDQSGTGRPGCRRWPHRALGHDAEPDPRRNPQPRFLTG